MSAASIMAGDPEDDVSRKATRLHGLIQRFQESFTSIERVRGSMVCCLTQVAS